MRCGGGFQSHQQEGTHTQIHEPVGGQLDILAKGEVEKIHGAAMEVLERLGIKVWSEKGLKLFADAGAEVDKKTMMVKMDEGLVMDTIHKAPSSFDYYGRDPSYRLLMGKNRVHFSLCGMGVKVQDLDGRVRLATLQDCENMALIGDYCENIHHIAMMTTPTDVPPETMHIYALWGNLKNSVKTTDGYVHGTRWADETLGLAAIVRGSEEELIKKPLLLGFVNPVSPMQLSKELVDGAIQYAKYMQPVLYAPEALAGGTAPATLAGLMVQQTAEVLSGIMVSQIANPGAPVLFGTVSAVLDMKTGATALGGPEVGLFNLATAQLARYYKLPCRGTGGNSDSKLVDVQAGIETSLSMLLAAYAGMNFMYDAAGSLDGSITTSFEKIVVDNEVCGMVSRILRGIEVTDETLAVDEIVRVGPAASFLGTPFTLKHFRKEHFMPELLDRRSRDSWVAAGRKGMAQVAREKVRWILKNHTPKPLEKDVLSEGEAFVKKIVKGYGH
ncbi:MAG: trimethylamine methyltransferase family protein [Thermoplasmata archaeon]